MRVYFFGLLTLLLFTNFTNRQGSILYKGKDVKITIQADKQFLGTYKGKGKGFLTLNSDGTGTYQYNYQIGSCRNESFSLRWGFIKDENGSPVSFDRDYGVSYPVLFQSTEGKRFKGCQEDVFLDWILVKKDGIHISSSDDWKK